MAAPRSPLPVLIDIRDAIDRISRYVAGRTEAALEQDELLKDGIERCIEIISEASRRIPAEMKALHPDIPWTRIAGIGNVLRHDYDEVDPTQLWPIITDHLPPLRAAIESLIRRIGC